MHDKTKGGRSQPLPSGFTPVLDHLIKKYDLATAAVYGRIWRFAQGDRGQCDASLGSMANELKLDRATIWRKIQLLKNGKYIRSISGRFKGRPSIYWTTGKAEKESEKLQEQKSRGVAQNNTPYAENQTGVAQSNRGLCREQYKETREETAEKEVKENDDDHDHPPSFTFSDDDFEAVKTAWLETIGRISKKQKMKLTKHVQKYSCSSVVEAIDKMSDYARNPNMVYLEKILDSSNGNQRKKNYVPNEFAEFIE